MKQIQVRIVAKMLDVSKRLLDGLTTIGQAKSNMPLENFLNVDGI